MRHASSMRSPGLRSHQRDGPRASSPPADRWIGSRTGTPKGGSRSSAAGVDEGASPRPAKRGSVSQRAWELEARHRVGGVTSVDASLRGRLDDADVRTSSLRGTVHASESDLQAVLQMLSDTGLASVPQDVVTGSVRATAEIQGTVAEPILQLAWTAIALPWPGRRSPTSRHGGDLAARCSSSRNSPPHNRVPGVETASGRVHITGRYNLKGGKYTAAVTANSWRIVPTSEVPLSGPVDVEYSGRGRGRVIFGKARLASSLTVSPDIALGEVVVDADFRATRPVSPLALRRSTRRPTQPSA